MVMGCSTDDDLGVHGELLPFPSLSRMLPLGVVSPAQGDSSESEGSVLAGECAPSRSSLRRVNRRSREDSMVAETMHVLNQMDNPCRSSPSVGHRSKGRRDPPEAQRGAARRILASVQRMGVPPTNLSTAGALEALCKGGPASLYGGAPKSLLRSGRPVSLPHAGATPRSVPGLHGEGGPESEKYVIRTQMLSVADAESV